MNARVVNDTVIGKFTNSFCIPIVPFPDGNGWHENENDPAPFIKYMLGIVLAAYRDFEARISLVDDKLPAIEMVRKAVCKKIGKFTKSEIMELVPFLSKASVENSLTQLMKDGVVDRHGKGKATFYTRADV